MNLRERTLPVSRTTISSFGLWPLAPDCLLSSLSIGLSGQITHHLKRLIPGARSAARLKSSVEHAGQTRWLIGTEDDLLKNADARAFTIGDGDDLLYVEVLGRRKVDGVRVISLAVNGQFTLPATLLPRRMAIACLFYTSPRPLASA